MSEDLSLLAEVGGREVLERVHKKFYDKLYEHAWLKHFFAEVDQKVIENQQTDFMVSNMGGGRVYSGKLPKPAHKHMNITDEMFEERNRILKESILECGVRPDLAERWLKIDYAFKRSLVKNSLSECEKRFFTDEILDFPKPPNF
ncbi:MAG: group 1 truncated hemoglobin [Nitrospinae bacterium CG11_big_fil_rev_8_21_14_0_20_45_15]|nr:MAG: group 1 truncated hemoglobin [Nitrospinae bacterium CG11_big_fil_rev_8_21_14_0_20_45_15]